MQNIESFERLEFKIFYPDRKTIRGPLRRSASRRLFEHYVM